MLNGKVFSCVMTGINSLNSVFYFGVAFGLCGRRPTSRVVAGDNNISLWVYSYGCGLDVGSRRILDFDWF